MSLTGNYNILNTLAQSFYIYQLKRNNIGKIRAHNNDTHNTNDNQTVVSANEEEGYDMLTFGFPRNSYT